MPEGNIVEKLGSEALPALSRSRLSHSPLKEKHGKVSRLCKISVIICTKDRPKDLHGLLQTLLKQTYTPFEVIIVDDSLSSFGEEVANFFKQRFSECELRYFRGYGGGLPAARNFGVKASRGDVVLFLDDDTLIQNNVLHSFAAFLETDQNLAGVQGYIEFSIRGIENAIYKTLLLSHYEQNKLSVRRSGASIFPYSFPLTEKINAQRLDGCCMCYRRQLFNELRFDTNLKQWGFMEDLDFSYRVYKKRGPESLCVVPHAVITHKTSPQSRLTSKIRVYMMTVYWFYVFFKDVFENSMLNLMAFSWALIGNLVITIGGLVVKKKPKSQRWELVYLINSYFYAFKHLGEIRNRNLGFLDEQLKRFT